MRPGNRRARQKKKSKNKMRHRKRHSKLSMKPTRRKATLRNMVASLIKHQRIETTLARAKEARRLAEKVISLAKTDTVNARRTAYSVLADRDLIMKLFKETAPLFKNKNSGFTRIIQTGFRRGDGASLAILELTEKKIIEKLPKKKKEKAKAEETTSDKHVRAEGEEEVRKHKEEPKKEARKEETKLKTISKAKPTVAEEKSREKARSEDKKVADKRGFMKNLRGLFRKRGDF